MTGEPSPRSRRMGCGSSKGGTQAQAQQLQPPQAQHPMEAATEG
eukprot:SAG22_NODE_18263_length_290_cov_0.816754_1_plen_43_part_10